MESEAEASTIRLGLTSPAEWQAGARIRRAPKPREEAGGAARRGWTGFGEATRSAARALDSIDWKLVKALQDQLLFWSAPKAYQGDPDGAVRLGLGRVDGGLVKISSWTPPNESIRQDHLRKASTGT